MIGSNQGTVSWRELLTEATAALAKAEMPGSSTDARRIIEAAGGFSPSEVVLHLDDAVTVSGVSRFERMVGRRLEGEPLQYVLGAWAFRSLDLMVDRRVLIPRPETETVVEVALAQLDALAPSVVEPTVVDLGTGSGAIGLSIAVERVRSRVWITDASEEALDVARANIAGVGRAGARITAEAGDWYEALPESLRGSVDLIISNPPYISDSAELPDEVARWEPAGALRAGPVGVEDLLEILAGAGVWLKAHGSLVCELSPEQARQLAEVAETYFREVWIEPDLTGRDRTLVARGPR